MAIPDPQDTRNIVLTGFMASGKSTIGRRLADRLHRPFLDCDVEIVKRAGKPIAQIFAEDGEPAFRQMERELVEELASQSGLVIATGGGMLVDPINRQRMIDTGVVICLDTPPEDIERRLSGSKERPLASNWRELYEKRREAYQAIPYHVNTAGLSPGQTTERILALWRKLSR